MLSGAWKPHNLVNLDQIYRQPADTLLLCVTGHHGGEGQEEAWRARGRHEPQWHACRPHHVNCFILSAWRQIEAWGASRWHGARACHVISADRVWGALQVLGTRVQH